jgi:CheY-like chemotaxis protein
MPNASSAAIRVRPRRGIRSSSRESKSVTAMFRSASALNRADESRLSDRTNKISAPPPTEMLACESKIRQPFCDGAVLIQIRSGELDLAKILVVDDDIAVQATIRILLERAGHSVVVATDGRKGLAIFETGEFDLLFLDIFMPGMDGLETMRLVHQQQPLIPIIVISGNPVTSDSGSGPDFLTMATKLGAVMGLQKPFKPAALLAAVAGSLEAAQCASSSSLPAGEVASRP